MPCFSRTLRTLMLYVRYAKYSAALRRVCRREVLNTRKLILKNGILKQIVCRKPRRPKLERVEAAQSMWDTDIETLANYMLRGV